MSDPHFQSSSQVVPGSGSGHLLSRRFSDIDELAAYVPEGKNIKLTQLSLSPFACDSITLNLETVRFSFNYANCALQVVGAKSPGYITFVGLPYSQQRPVIAHGLSLTGDFVFGFDPNRQVDMVFPGHSLHCAVSVHQDIFEACAEVMDRPDLNARFLALNCLFMPEALPPLQTYLKQIYQLLNQRSKLVEQPNFQQLILQDFLPLLIAALPLQQEKLKRPLKLGVRSRLVKQATAYMQDHLHQPLTLRDLCNALSTSSRTLSYGYDDVFGMSPMAYLKTVRLQGVHRALKQATPQTTSITQLANQFGFWSLNHFAKDYKAMFGETPWRTLTKVTR